MDIQQVTRALPSIEQWVTQWYRDQVPAIYCFHDYRHTINVRDSALQIASALNLKEEEKILLTIAAYFHDTGYSGGPDQHEQRSVEIFHNYIQTTDPNGFHGLQASELKIIEGCILATKIPHVVNNLLEEVLCDADLAHLGQGHYWETNSLLRQEFVQRRPELMDEERWLAFEIEFIANHTYHTTIARVFYDKKKEKHLRNLVKQIKLYQSASSGLSGGDKNPANQVLLDTGRGVETMYRTTYRTHIALSTMADSKANIMLSVNAIIISVLFSRMLPQVGGEDILRIPSMIILVSCVISMIYATLSTRPKITQGFITRQDIDQRKGNLLFFGNYFNMSLEDYQYGMMELINDEKYLYSTMTRDLYFLGKVLAQKYKFLTMCYNVFMIGIISACLYACAMLIMH